MAEGFRVAFLILFPLAVTPNSTCHTVTADDPCFVHAQWAHRIGLKTHPECELLASCLSLIHI